MHKRFCFEWLLVCAVAECTEVQWLVACSSECMVVPPPMWRSLRAWLPLDVEHELCKDPESEEDSINVHVSRPVTLTDESGERTYRRTCPLLQRANTRPLPSLSFTLSQTSRDSPRLQLPLEHLVIHEPGVGEVLCVVPQPFLSMGADQWRQIRFGTRGLFAFHTSDMTENNRKCSYATISQNCSCPVEWTIHAPSQCCSCVVLLLCRCCALTWCFPRVVCISASAVLSAFKVVMDRDNWRVGLQEKSPEPNNDSACAARAECMSVKSCSFLGKKSCSYLPLWLRV